MIQAAINYAIVIDELQLPARQLQESREIWEATELLAEVLTSPALSKHKKEILIKRLFPENMHSLLLVMLRHQDIDLFLQVCDAYQMLQQKKQGILPVIFFYVEKPDTERQKQMEQAICRRFRVEQVIFEWKYRPELIGGFALQIGDLEINESVQSSLSRLRYQLMKK